MPPLLAHSITNFQDVDSGILLGPESDDGDRGITKNIELRDLGFNAVDNLSSGGDDILR